MIALLLVLAACESESGVPVEPKALVEVEPTVPAASTPTPAATAVGSQVSWNAPDEASIPAGPIGDSVRRGLALFTRTSELLPEYAPGNINCSNCHLDRGRKADAVPMVGATARFPKYMERTGAVIALQDRVNYCFTRSLSGSRMPADSQEMTDLVSYITWLSQDVPVGKHIEGEVLPPMEKGISGDAGRGEKLFAEKCVACHQADGGGVKGAFPALWGPSSYSIGASMAREERAASFVWRFMPQNAPGTLSPQDAFDLSAFVNSHPRPDSPAKEKDWPEGGAPGDVPYATKGHEAYRPPKELLPRAHADRAVVPKPPPIATSAGTAL